ncbi:hypothetical protein ACF053_27220 [Streptomyces kanasensis]|uniref:hypothetical protein n=1 Tax=Streptomyces kanasensis TaxID=936756 RepID=UPI0037008D83
MVSATASPQQLAGEDPDLDEQTKETMTQPAASLGCVYDLCVDYDFYDSGTPYYAWWVHLPAARGVAARLRRPRRRARRAAGAVGAPSRLTPAAVLLAPVPLCLAVAPPPPAGPPPAAPLRRPPVVPPAPSAAVPPRPRPLPPRPASRRAALRHRRGAVFPPFRGPAAVPPPLRPARPPPRARRPRLRPGRAAPLRRRATPPAAVSLSWVCSWRPCS